METTHTVEEGLFRTPDDFTITKINQALNGFEITAITNFADTEEGSFGLNTGILLSDNKYFVRVISGIHLQLFVLSKWYVNAGLNYGLSLITSESSHNPDNGISRFYYSLSLGRQLSETISIGLKYSEPLSNLYGLNSRSSRHLINKYYLNSMFSISLEYDF